MDDIDIVLTIEIIEGSMGGKAFLPVVLFAMILLVLPVRTFAQDVQATTAQPKASYSLKLAQNSDCDQARNNANSCRSSWTNIGGGTSGQAGAFYQCWKTYCTLLQAHACNTPSYCSQ